MKKIITVGAAVVLLVAVTAVTGKAAGVSNVKVYEPPYVAAKGQDVVRLTSNPALKANPALEADAYAAVSESVLWRFDVDDGLFPFSNLIADKWGNLYGTTVGGGPGEGSFYAPGGGTVFELSPPIGKQTQWSRRVLWNFGVAAEDGRNPYAGLLADKWGNLYGTTVAGGSTLVVNPDCASISGCGTVFELSPPTGKSTQWTERILWNFLVTTGDPISDGIEPQSSLIADRWGNLYGTTTLGGANIYGTVFELSPPTSKSTQWTERMLWQLGAGSDGQIPTGSLIFDKEGNLYATTSDGGACSFCGTAFEVSPPIGKGTQWSERVLWQFGVASGDGTTPSAALLADKWGNLYGTNYDGGAINGNGAVFELTPPREKSEPWSERVLWSFNRDDGEHPYSTLIPDSRGNLYGTTIAGGANDGGTVFEVSPPAGQQTQWSESVLRSFGSDSDDAAFPFAGLLSDQWGNLYGTTHGGGGPNNWGTVFKLSVPGWGQ